MGRLRHLELENFKSYGGKQVVGPFDDFTCVIGPNGSGKSNMMDAVSFVLGVQSRNLRATQLKDLIFRRDSDSAPARKASVKLVYEVSEDEVKDKAAGSELHFMRSITSSGVSTYRLDNKDVTFEVYEKTLQDIGVLVKARNFLVFQGDVESVASKSPAELTKLLEQISGSDAYRAEYEELSTKKDEADATALLLLQKRKMYATQKKEVKDQKDEAELFQSKQEHLQDLKSESVLMQIWKIREGMEEHQANANTYKSDLEGVKERESTLESDIQDGKKELARVSKSLATAEAESAKKTKQVGELMPKLEETRARLKSLRKRLEELKKGIQAVEKDRDQQDTDVEDMKGHIQKLELVEKEIQAQLDRDASGSLKLDAKKVEQYTKLREEVAARTATQRAEEITLEQDVQGKTQHSLRLESQESSLRNEMESGDKLIAEYAGRLTKLQSAITEGTRDCESLKRERDTKKADMDKSQALVAKLTTDLDEVSNKLKEAGEDRRRNKHEERLNEAVETMQRIFAGVHGKLVDLCKPIQNKYAQAVATAAGKHMDAIVVETKQVAAECIRYLKDQRIGTCIFLPLDNMDPTKQAVPDRLRTFAPKYRLCIDLMDCDEKIKPALAYALGSTLVCETLEEAQDLCFTRGEKTKVVTTRGHVISKNGAMTGGSAAGGGGGNRWEEKEVERLKRRKGEMETELANTRKSAPTRQELIDLETRIKTLLTRIQFSEADRNVTDEKLKQLRQQKDLKDKALRTLRSEVEALKKELTKIENRKAQLHQIIRDVENEIFAPFSASVNVDNIREYEETQLKKHQANVKKRTAIAEQRASLVAQLEYALKRDFSGVLERLEAQSVDAKADVTGLEKQEASYLGKEGELRMGLRQTNETVASLKTERESANQLVKKKQMARSVVVDEREGFSRKLASEEILIERARSHLHEILQKAQVEEVALPTLDVDADSEQGADEELLWGGDSQNKSQGGKKRGRGRDRASSEDTSSSTSGGGSKTTDSTHFSQSDNKAVVADRKKMATVDLSSMRKLKSMSKQDLTALEASLQQRIAALIAELETIQPNMHAVERFENVTEKLKECEAELTEHSEKTAAISERWEDVQKTRLDLFQECFDHVSNVLGVVYKDLTKSTKHPAGGNAYLTLEDNNMPFLYGTRFTAMPPMKRFRDMDQLSGGEKTMAALALLFSIHSYRQAPFFVLDEVDAALDNVNVKKVSVV